MFTSRVSSKGRITIPKPLRRRLGLSSGDVVEYQLDGPRVIVTRRASIDSEWASAISATVGEWDSPEDDNAFRDL